MEKSPVNNKWGEYFENTKDHPPRELLKMALPFVKERNEALDLGAGALNDARYLVGEGFRHITAVDNKPLAQEVLLLFPEGSLDYVVTSFENFDFKKESYDLINAQYSLPFCSRDALEKVTADILASLKSGGVFTGNFFGVRDEWNQGQPEMNFQTAESVKNLFVGCKIVSFNEEENDAKTALGEMKHWHKINIIIVK